MISCISAWVCCNARALWPVQIPPTLTTCLLSSTDYPERSAERILTHSKKAVIYMSLPV